MTGTPGFPGTFWYLEGFTGEGERLRRVPILGLPFRIGRRPGLGLTLGSTLVSQRHAEIFAEGGKLRIRDLDSTNGTFLNLQPVEGEPSLTEGDILHFAQHEFRLGSVTAGETAEILDKTQALDTVLPRLQVDRTRRLRELLASGAVISVFQPIVSLEDDRVLGYEVLGRGGDDELPGTTPELFSAATTLGAEAELSRLFREKSVEDCLSLPGDLRFFINTHPKELGTPELVASLRDLRRRAPALRFALEIHEGAVTDPPMMKELRAVLEELDIRIAYDDFGAGQARLLELAEASPDYLKFDRSLIHGIDQGSPSRRTVLGSLVEMVLDLGIAPIAEGLETAADARRCRDLGFRYGQGFLFGTPVPARTIELGRPS